MSWKIILNVATVTSKSGDHICPDNLQPKHAGRNNWHSLHELIRPNDMCTAVLEVIKIFAVPMALRLAHDSMGGKCADSSSDICPASTVLVTWLHA